MRVLKWAGLCVILAIIGITAGCDGGSTTADPAYDRMIASNKLRVGYITYPPSFITDPNTRRFSGISHDVLLKAAENMGVEVVFVEETTWGSMIEAVESGRVDVIATGIWPTAARGKRADFTVPIFYSPVKAYVRVGDTRFDGNLGAANSPDYRIASIDGEMAATIAAADFPRARNLSLPQSTDVSQLLLNVGMGRADLTFVEPAIALAYMAKNPGQLRAVADVPSVRAFPTAYLLSKSSPRLRSTLDIAIAELINNGDVDRILARYEEHPDSFIRIQRVQ